MAEGQATQFAFTHAQIITELIRAADVRDGTWSLMIQFGMGVGAFATIPGAGASPGAVITIQGIGIERHDGPIPPGSIVVNAAEVQR